jgi:cysteine desulfurase
MRIYLDNAATTPISEEVIETMSDCMRNAYGNPSSIHSDGIKVRAMLEKARKKVASCIGASISEVFFTSGGTESNNMVLKGAVRDLGVQRIITSRIEHHCVLHTVESLAKYHDIQVNFVEIDELGRVDLTHLETLLQQTTHKTLVSLMHANNEIGTMIDLDNVAQLCEAHKALFHSDTVQTIGHFPIHVGKTKIHFLSAGAHKFHGAKGTGFVYISNEAMLKPFIDGGSQERNMRGGTENVYGIVGMAKALELASDNMEARKTHIENIRNYLKDSLLENFEDIQFNGDYDGNALYTVLSVSFPPSPRAELLLWNLDIAGISCSGGSACSSGAEGGSHVIQGIRGDATRKTIRFSFSHYNTKSDIDFVIEKLKTLVTVRELAMA